MNDMDYQEKAGFLIAIPPGAPARTLEIPAFSRIVAHGD
jgi:hypothetical protein